MLLKMQESHLNKITLNIILLLLVSGCSGISDYAKNILSDPRNERLVYKTDTDYSSAQKDLIIPPDLTSPESTRTLDLPEYLENDDKKLFSIDTKLENIAIYKQGKEMYLSVKTKDKLILWDRLKSFWTKEGFLIVNEDLTISSMKTNFLENLSEAQLGTVQRVVGRYVPLLVSPETRDSYKTRIIKKNDGFDIIVTHYGKEFMSDGDSEFRWQNRERDIEFENEMISRLYIFLGGDEAKQKGYIVSKSTGIRDKASLTTDEKGLQTLFIPDIYERVYPAVLESIEKLGVNIISHDQGSGSIRISFQDQQETNVGSLFSFFSDDESQELNIKLSLGGEKGEHTFITIENDSYTQIQSAASDEVMRGLFVNMR